MIELKRLTPDEVPIWDPHVWSFIESACARSHGRYAPQHIMEWARTGEWQIWVVLEGGAVSFVFGTEVILFPTGMKAIAFRFGTGHNREHWQHRIDDVLAWGKAQGCDMAEGVFRKGWRRVLPGWNHTHKFLEKAL